MSENVKKAKLYHRIKYRNSVDPNSTCTRSESFDANLKRRNRVIRYMRKVIAEKSLAKRRNVKVTPLREISTWSHPDNDLEEFCKNCPTTAISRFQERDILRRVAVPKLQEAHRSLLKKIMDENREEYLRVTHEAGIGMKLKSQGHLYKLKPYRYLGQTENHSAFLARRKQLEGKFLLHNPLFKRILNECITSLPYELFNLNHWLRAPMEFKEFQNQLQDLANDSSQYLQEFYRKIVSEVERTDITGAQNSANYLDACTGLLSVNISRTIAHTLLHVVNFTASKEHTPYLKLNITFDDRLILEPTADDIVDIYTKFLQKLVTSAKIFHVLKKYKSQGFESKHIYLCLTAEFFESCIGKINENVTTKYVPIINYMRDLENDFVTIYHDISSKGRVHTKDLIFEDGFSKILHYKSYLRGVMYIPNNMYFPIGQLNLSEYRENLRVILITIVDDIFEKLSAQHEWENNDICEGFEIINVRATQKPTTTEEVIEIGKYMVWVKDEYLNELKERVIKTLEYLTELIQLGALTDSHMEINARAINWIDEINPILNDNNAIYEQLKFEAEEKLQRIVEDVNVEIKDVYPLLSILDAMDNVKNVRTYLNSITLHMVRIREIENRIEWINLEEVSLSFPKSSYAEFEELKNYVHPFYHLLKLCLNVQRSLFVWLDGQFDLIDYNRTKVLVEKYHGELLSTQKMYRSKLRQAQDENLSLRFKGTVDDPDMLNWPAPLKLCFEAIKLIEEFEPALTVIKIMCNEALTKRHWNEMSEVAGFDITPNAGTTLRKIIQIDLKANIDKYEIISIAATREKELLESLLKMQQEWTQVNFTQTKHKQTLILTGLDRIESLSVQHIIKVIEMLSSIFVKPYETRVRNFHVKLTKTRVTLEQLHILQREILKLSPVLNSKLIRLHLQHEIELFTQIRTTFATYIDGSSHESNVHEILDNTPFLEDLMLCNSICETINSGIQSYFERIREDFPRLYFRTYPEMIDLHSKKPWKIYHQITKIFKSVANLNFNGNREVIAITNNTGEKFVLAKNVPTEGCKIEHWLRNLETEIFNTLKIEIINSVKTYGTVCSETWIRQNSCQTLLATSQINFTKATEKALQNGGMIETKQSETVSQDLIQMSRESSAILSNADKIKIQSLIVLNFHNNEKLKSPILDANDFNWISVFRYYVNCDDSVTVRIFESGIPYQYEYLGNFNQAVITPDTERCHHTMITALNNYLLSICEGSTGFNKVETIKSLADMFAIYLVTFPCSSHVNLSILMNFLKGIVSNSSWLCLENFNSLTPEVISLLSQQLSEITAGLRRCADRIVIGSTQLNLNKCFVSIITNHPTENLPESLKVQIRCFKMPLPDYKMIAEVSLVSYGFQQSHSLSRLIVLVLQFCKQLSLIDDFSMRVVMEILKMSSNIKSSEEETIINALRVVILPKIESTNISFFEKILLDSCPQYHPVHLNVNLRDDMIETCVRLNLEPQPEFCDKCIQLLEISSHKKVIAVVGGALSGKSTIIKIFHEFSTKSKIHKTIINPIVSSFDELYGYMGQFQWINGLITSTIRNTDKHWLIFDGRLDPIWSENLNSMLDSKKLILTNGEIISTLSTDMILFEVGDLIDASPSLVSRCGVIYVDFSTINWRSLIKSWVEKMNPEWVSYKDMIFALLEWIIPPSLDFVSNICSQSIEICDKALIKTLLDIFEMFLNEIFGIARLEDDFKNISTWIQASIVQASIWSLGSPLNSDSKIKFDDFTKQLWKNQTKVTFSTNLDKIEITLPTEGSIIDYIYVFKSKGVWKYCPDSLKYEKLEEVEYSSEFFVPTAETVKFTSIIMMHLKYRKSFLLIGPPTVGKTLTLRNILINKIDCIKYQASFVNLTPEITSKKLRELILNKLYRNDLNHYSPRDGKSGLLFIDDLNLPTTQPPIELLRQFFDHKSWFGPDIGTQIYINDLTVIAAMTVDVLNRRTCQRFLRHLNILSMSDLSVDTITRIYSNVLSTSWKKLELSNDVISTLNQIISGTWEIYRRVKLTLKPIPSQKLYKFDLRNFSKVIQGCGLIKKESIDSNKKLVFKLWSHEVLRVFGDRLSDKNCEWLCGQVISILKDLNEDLDLIFDNVPKNTKDIWDLNQLIFNSSGSHYDESNLKQFFKVSSNALKDFNKNNPHKLDIVLFNYALIHLSRICRVLISPRSNLVLVGLYGCGRESLTKLACQIQNQKFFRLNFCENYNFNHWRSDIKIFLKEAAGCGRSCAVLMREEELSHSQYYEDLDLILKSHEIPDLYESLDEKQEIIELVRVLAQGGNKNLDISSDSLKLYYQKLVHENFHLITCFNPISKNFQQVVHNYPSIISYSDVDCFTNWPSDALETIAEYWLNKLEIDREIKGDVVLSFSYFHNTVRNIQNPLITTTTGSYLEFIKLYIDLVARKQELISNVKQRYLMALEKLSFAAVEIHQMQKSLAEYQPQLEAMTTTASEMTKQIEKETIEVEKASNLVKQDEKIANEQAAAAQVLKLDCEADLAQAIPILEDAISALNTLKPTDITLVKSMKNPPDAIKLVMAAVCVIKDVRPDRIPDPSTGRKTIDYWGPSKRILGDMNFLQTLKDFDKDHIKSEIIIKIRKEYLPHKDFKPHVVAKASSAAEGLCKWIIAMDMYDKVAKEVAPKKEKLEKAEREYGGTLAILNEKKEQVARIEQKLADLNVMLDEATKKQQKLQRNVNICKRKLERAQKLIGGLSQEKIRWTKAVEKLQNQYNHLSGDILVTSATIAYLGPFDKKSRCEIVEKWVSHITSREIPLTESYDFVKNFDQDLDIENWTLNGLPTDSYFIHSAIIGKFTKRWCLFVDPYDQISKWIRKTEKLNNLKIMKPNYNLVEQISEAMTLGRVILIEKMNELRIFTSLIYKINLFQPAATYVFFEGNVTKINPNFAMYLTTDLKNVKVEPEIAQKVNVIDFALNAIALSDELLTLVVEIEKPMMKKLRETIDSENTKNKAAFHNIEETILRILSESKVDILEDEQALKILDESKIEFRKIEENHSNLLQSKRTLTDVRCDYFLVAKFSAILYFCIFDLSKINHMYQFNLTWFTNVYVESIQKAHNYRNLEKRRESLLDTIVFEVFSNVSTSIFVKDKLFLAFTIAVNLLRAQKKITDDEIQLLTISTIISSDSEEILTKPEWLRQDFWTQICYVSRTYSYLGDFLRDNENLLLKILESKTPEEVKLLDPWNGFAKLIIIKIMRPERLFPTIENFVSQELGERFITPQSFNINKSFLQSHILSPIIFILKPGSDLLSSLLSFAKIKNFDKKFSLVTMRDAISVINKAKSEGLWVCIQNCHLFINLLSRLEVELEDIDYNVTHENFRLWLTTNESHDFPVSLLQRSVKVTKEAPRGLKEKLLDLFTSEPINTSNFYSSCPGKQDIFARLLYSLAFFHCMCQERLLFGPYGWSNPKYIFSENDFKISITHLQDVIKNYCKPLNQLLYLIAECNYGGQVINIWDRRLVITFLEDFLSFSYMGSGYFFNNVEGYGFPTRNDQQDYLKYINNLPSNRESARIVNLHTNCDYFKNHQLSKQILKSISVAFSSQNFERLDYVAVLEIIKTKLPENFAEILDNIVISSEDVFISKLIKVEVSEYRHLFNVIESTLIKSARILNEGDPDSCEILEVISRYKVPHLWMRSSFIRCTSLGKFLSSLRYGFRYICDLANSETSEPLNFGFFFNPGSFILAIKLKYSQHFAVGHDEIVFRLEIPKSDGVLLSGLRLVGGQWREGWLEELSPGILGNDLETSVLRPSVESQIDEYECPMYRAISGPSLTWASNFIQAVFLHTKTPSKHWVKRGVALFCQFDGDV